MRTLWYLFIALVTLGSIYPFNFTTAEISGTAISEFLGSCCGRPGRGDTVANIILFMPVGFTGMLGVWLDRPVRRRMFLVFFWGALVALFLQVLQLFLPSRDENLQDVLWNAIGILAGAAVAIQINRLALVTRNSRDAIDALPIVLVGTWLVYRLMPFVPSIDWQLIKDSVKPIFNEPVSYVGWLGDAAAWSIVAFLLYDSQKSRALARHFVFLVAAVVLLEIFIVANSVSLTTILGAMTAVLAWQFFLRGHKLAVPVLIAALVASLSLSGLYPFSLRLSAADFNWLPFGGYLGGSMFINAQSAAEKVFLYGSLVYLLWETRLGRKASVAAAFMLVFLIENAQTFFLGHTPEITDPLLVLFAAFSMIALERYADRASSLHTDFVRQKSGAAEGQRKDSDRKQTQIADHAQEIAQTAYVIELVNLRGSQVAFLQEIAKEMDETMSGVVSRVVEQFVDTENLGLYKEKDIKWIAAATGATRSKKARQARSVYQSWEQRSIEIRGELHDALSCIAEDADISVSRAIRRMISRFMDRLDED